jgi:hypothetical protein
MVITTEAVLTVLYALAAVGFAVLAVYIRRRTSIVEDRAPLPMQIANPILAARLRNSPASCPSSSLSPSSNIATVPSGLPRVECTASEFLACEANYPRTIRNQKALSLFFSSVSVSFAACLCRAIVLPFHWPLIDLLEDPDASRLVQLAALLAFDVGSVLPVGWRLFAVLVMTSYWSFMLSVAPQLVYLRVPPLQLQRLMWITGAAFAIYSVCGVLIDVLHLLEYFSDLDGSSAFESVLVETMRYTQMVANLTPLCLSFHLCACVGIVFSRRKTNQPSKVVWDLFGGQFKSFCVAAGLTCANVAISCLFIYSSEQMHMYDEEPGWNWENFWYFFLEIVGGACACLALFFAATAAQKTALDAAEVDRKRKGWTSNVWNTDPAHGAANPPFQPGNITGFADDHVV